MSVYLDHNATSFLLKEAFVAMRPWLEKGSGNASSLHSFGREAKKVIEKAREEVALAVGALPDEIIFTSGATEANNLFLKNVDKASFLLSEIEHPSAIQPAWQRAQKGSELRFIAPNLAGEITEQSLNIALSQNPAEVVAVMMANNETGVINDVLNLSGVVQENFPQSFFYTDAVQALGKIPFSFEKLKEKGVAAMALSAHKIGGPQGVGALVFRRDVDFSPLLAGGGQEGGLRSGTENVAGIVGFGAAAKWVMNHQKEYAEHTFHLRETLEKGLKQLNAEIFGETAKARLPNTLYFAFPNIEGATLVGELDAMGFAVGSGSACGSGKTRASYVLKAMRAPHLQGGVRVSLGMENKEEEIFAFLSTLEKILKRLRALESL